MNFNWIIIIYFYRFDHPTLYWPRPRLLNFGDRHALVAQPSQSNSCHRINNTLIFTRFSKIFQQFDENAMNFRSKENIYIYIWPLRLEKWFFSLLFFIEFIYFWIFKMIYLFIYNLFMNLSMNLLNYLFFIEFQWKKTWRKNVNM